MSGLEHFRPCVKAQLMECSLYAKRFKKIQWHAKKRIGYLAARFTYNGNYIYE